MGYLCDLPSLVTGLKKGHFEKSGAASDSLGPVSILGRLVGPCNHSILTLFGCHPAPRTGEASIRHFDTHERSHSLRKHVWLRSVLWSYRDLLPKKWRTSSEGVPTMDEHGNGPDVLKELHFGSRTCNGAGVVRVEELSLSRDELETFRSRFFGLLDQSGSGVGLGSAHAIPVVLDGSFGEPKTAATTGTWLPTD